MGTPVQVQLLLSAFLRVPEMGFPGTFFVNVNGGHIMDYTDVIIIKGPVETLSFFFGEAGGDVLYRIK